MADRKDRAPWKHDDPHHADGDKPRHLSAKEKAEAKRSASQAGRPYPNLVDNLRVLNRRRAKKER